MAISSSFLRRLALGSKLGAPKQQAAYTRREGRTAQLVEEDGDGGEQLFLLQTEGAWHRCPPVSFAHLSLGSSIRGLTVSRSA